MQTITFTTVHHWIFTFHPATKKSYTRKINRFNLSIYFYVAHSPDGTVGGGIGGGPGGVGGVAGGGSGGAGLVPGPGGVGTGALKPEKSELLQCFVL